MTARLYKHFANYCEAKGIDATESRIRVQVDYLTARYSEQEIIKAVSKLFGESQWFPDASMVIAKIKPSSDEVKLDALAMSGEIIAAISSKGQYQAVEAKKMLGATAWYAVERFGGWNYICGLQYDELNTARAQLRDLCRSAIHITNRDIDDARQLPYQQSANDRMERLQADEVGEEINQKVREYLNYSAENTKKINGPGEQS
jgi:hypothetical protein